MTEEYANWSARDRAPADDEQGLRAAIDEPQPTRRDAVLALVDAAEEGLEEETVADLETIIREESDPETRQFAVEALGVAGAGLSEIEQALDDDEEWVRAEAVVALSRTAPGATDRLSAILDEDESGWVRRNALVALAKLGAADEDTYVDCIKTDPHPSVREYGAQYLRTGEDTERCVRILAAILAREPNAFVRVKSAESLGEFGTERAQEALEQFGIGDASDDVRRTAKQALARARGVDPDQLEVEEPPAPGTGPDTPGQRQAGPVPEGGLPEHRQGGQSEPPSGPSRPPSQHER
jgi:HEAT repeat protein